MLLERVNPEGLAERQAAAEQARVRRGAPPLPRRIREETAANISTRWWVRHSSAERLFRRSGGDFAPTERSPLRFLTHSFIHESGLHLLVGMSLFLILGFQLEAVWGTGVFVTFVAAASAGSAATFGIAKAEAVAPLIGMSGVIAALLGAFLIRFRSIWHQPIYAVSLVAGGLFLVLPIRLGTEWSLAVGIAATGDITAHGATLWATVGGFGCGVVGQGVIALILPSRRDSSGSDGVSSGGGSNPKLEKAICAHAAGRLNEAYGTLVELMGELPDDREVLLAMWEVALDHGRSSEAAAAMLRVIREELKTGRSADALEHWLDLVDRGLHADAEPALLIRLALALRKHDHDLAAIQALQQALAKSGEADVAVVAARVARASKDLDAETARSAAWQALGSLELDLEERQNLEGLLAEVGSGIDTTAAVLRREPREAGPVATDDTPAAVDAPVAWTDPALSNEADEARAHAGSAESEGRHTDSAGIIDSARSSDAEDSSEFSRAEPIDFDVTVRSLRSIAANPIALEPDGLRIEAEGGAKKRLPLEKLDAVSVAAVAGLGPKPVLLIDLVMNWTDGSREPLKVIRMRGDRFDARSFVRDAAKPLDALRIFIETLLSESGAAALPDEPSAKGMPFASFESLAAYERAVLGVYESDDV